MHVPSLSPLIHLHNTHDLHGNERVGNFRNRVGGKSYTMLCRTSNTAMCAMATTPQNGRNEGFQTFWFLEVTTTCRNRKCLHMQVRALIFDKGISLRDLMQLYHRKYHP